MGKVFGILVIVLAIWAGLEVYTEGTRHAFGGAFAFLAAEPEASAQEEPGSGARRVGDAVQRSHGEHAERFERALGD